MKCPEFSGLKVHVYTYSIGVLEKIVSSKHVHIQRMSSDTTHSIAGGPKGIRGGGREADGPT